MGNAATRAQRMTSYVTISLVEVTYMLHLYPVLVHVVHVGSLDEEPYVHDRNL